MNGKCVPTQKEEFNVFFFLSSLFLHVYYIQVHIPLGSVGGRWMIGVMPMCAAKRGESNFRALSGCLCVYNTYILVPYARARLQKFQQGRGIMRDSRSHLIPYSQCAVCIFAHANVNRCVLLDGLIPNFDFDGD